MSVKLLTKHHLEFLSLQGGCTGSSESTLVKMSHCWKSHVKAEMLFSFLCSQRLTDVKHFSMAYWLLALTIMFFYNGVFPFVADST